MVVADCENELFRDCTRGLEGGSFFVATLLNRKDAKLKKGKDAIDSLKDFISLKADARFCHYFLMKYNLNPNIDNTPDLLKSACPEKKETFLHEKVKETLKDLLPYFRSCDLSNSDMDDHPLQGGRRDKSQRAQDPSFDTTTTIIMEPPVLIDIDTAEQTSQNVHHATDAAAAVAANMEELSVSLSGTRAKKLFRCKICDFRSRFKTVCLTHIETCFAPEPRDLELVLDSTGQVSTR